MIPIKYIGKRPTYRDGAYSTGIEWVQGQTQLVPADKARLMLRHPDVYVPGDEAVTDVAVVAAPQAKDDDADASQEARDAIATMNKDALEIYAKTHFQIDLDKRLGVEKLRAKVAGLVDQYGLE